MLSPCQHNDANHYHYTCLATEAAAGGTAAVVGDAVVVEAVVGSVAAAAADSVAAGTAADSTDAAEGCAAAAGRLFDDDRSSGCRTPLAAAVKIITELFTLALQQNI